MKKRAKKYNPTKGKLITLNQRLKNKSFVYTSLDNEIFCFHNNKALRYLPDNQIIHSLQHHAFKWSTYMAVFGKDEFGPVYMKSKSLFIDTPCKQNEIYQFLNEEHQKLIQSFNTKHFYGVGWLSCPFEYDWTEEEAFQIFSYTGITTPDQLKEAVNE